MQLEHIVGQGHETHVWAFALQLPQRLSTLAGDDWVAWAEMAEMDSRSKL